MSDNGNKAGASTPQEAYAVSFHSVGDMFCREVMYPVADSMDAHSHAKAHLVFVLKGTVRSAWRKEAAFNAPGSLFYLPPDEPHANDFVPGFNSLDIWFAPSWLPKSLAPSEKLGQPLQCHGGAPIEALYRLTNEVRRPDDLTPLVMESMAIEVLAALIRQEWPEERGTPHWLRRAREVVHADFKSSVTLESVAAAVDIHPAHLSKTFKSHYGQNIGEYVRRLRVEEAKRLLSRSEAPLGDLALELGFADQSHFCRTFKRIAGLTPSEFRKSH